MAGCYDNDTEDKHFENPLLRQTACSECGGDWDMCICENGDDE